MGNEQHGNENITGFICNNLTLITGNTYTSEIMNRLSFGNLKCISLGLPRNDILFTGNDNTITLKEKLKLPKGKKFLLYAPTFRNDGHNTDGINPKRSGIEQLELLNIDSLLSALCQRFGGDWIFVCRFHYHVASSVDWNEINIKYHSRVLCGNISDDMADYLKCSDALLTDYSSAMFDFALTGKPCFLFIPDLEYYQNHERGFYIPIDELPFPSAESDKDLIKTILDYDETQFNSSVKVCLEKLGNVDDGNACKRVAKYIFDENYI
jgi:CDP-glycerol glycerophosphotransferase